MAPLAVCSDLLQVRDGPPAFVISLLKTIFWHVIADIKCSELLQAFISTESYPMLDLS